MGKRFDNNLQETVTIKDVAKRAETSIATVSYVLNNENRYLRPELRERVLQAASELGYVKNAAASSLKGKRRGILAILVAQFGNSFFTRMCVDIEAVARKEGYIVTICNSDDDPNQERIILERLIAQRIDGCILTPAMSLGENALLLQKHQVPFVVLERALGGQYTSYDFVGHDNFHSGYLATKRLLEAGHKHIAFMGWDSPIPNVRERVDGYSAALREHGIGPDSHIILLDELSPAAGHRMAEKLPLPEITAVVLGHHELAKGALLYFQHKEVYWPQDISVVLIGTPEWNEMLRPNLTCIQRPEKEMGHAAASVLIERLRNSNLEAVQKVFPCTVVEGRSVRNLLSGG
jgi:DNA-binding LacI/PurR family transcriptional regulator